MKRVKLLELGMKGTNFDMKIPGGTEASHINQALGIAIIKMAEYRGIKPATALAEIEQWVRQLEDNL